MSDRISELRNGLRRQGLQGFILPVNDEFMGEYVPDSAKRVTWLTGFTGSAGLAVITEQKAAFFTDGRYTLQAKTEVQGFELHNSGEMTPEDWLLASAQAGSIVGYDPMLHTLNALRRYEKTGKTLQFRPVTPNPVDKLWHDRPPPPASPVRIQDMRYAGEASFEKRTRIGRALLSQACDAAILTAPDSICWLLNIRGNDVPFTPFILCYAILEKSGALRLYLDKARIPADTEKHWGEGVEVLPPVQIQEGIRSLGGKTVLYDPASSPIWFQQQLKEAKANIVEAADPCQLPKACKNAAELEGMRGAHVRDGLAITKFLCWLDGADKTELTEMDVADTLESFRKASDLYLEPSFTTICGSGPDGAIVHYCVTPESNRTLDENSLLLLDSGGQYPDGTTDITRTIALGTPSDEMRDRFTRVLRGHIALARAVFPAGTSGGQLDSLARQFLWSQGLDYDHGTGHGVGSHLSVHEGPQRVSKRGGDAPLAQGMILSNEPGYYKQGEYGIRIESLVMVQETELNGKKFLSFETITLAPIDRRLIKPELLSADESEWLEAYHARVLQAHQPHLSAAESTWLKKFVTKP